MGRGITGLRKAKGLEGWGYPAPWAKPLPFPE